MTQTLELYVDRPLTDEERANVRAYARSLTAQRNAAVVPDSRHVNVAAIRGLLAGMGGDKGSKELIREAWDAATDKYMD